MTRTRRRGDWPVRRRCRWPSERTSGGRWIEHAAVDEWLEGQAGEADERAQPLFRLIAARGQGSQQGFADGFFGDAFTQCAQRGAAHLGFRVAGGQVKEAVSEFVRVVVV